MGGTGREREKGEGVTGKGIGKVRIGRSGREITGRERDKVRDAYLGNGKVGG